MVRCCCCCCSSVLTAGDQDEDDDDDEDEQEEEEDEEEADDNRETECAENGREIIGMTLGMIGELRLRVVATVVDELFVACPLGTLTALATGLGRPPALALVQ